MKKSQNVLRLVESALLLAVATVLSMIKLIDLPYGGSVTACSALPVLLIGYRHGTPYGLFSGVVYALVQLLLGLNTLSYCPTPLAVAAVIVLDYVLAFVVLGLGGIFRREGRSQGQALVAAAITVCALRYVFHVISGCTVWAGLSIPTEAALLYSLAYNATYMLPETLVTALGAWYLSRALDVGGGRIGRVASVGVNGRAYACSLVSKAMFTLTAITDVVLVFRHLQDAETGDFVITGLAQVSWAAVGIVTAVGVVLGIAAMLIGKKCNR
ncbi:MAG: energy-coupled thiamine transporter ThiT [Clostridia bacterium]|nr:energy-coupled thiamine transporter ThiT [Clostridia bacterium]